MENELHNCPNSNKCEYCHMDCESEFTYSSACSNCRRLVLNVLIGSDKVRAFFFCYKVEYLGYLFRLCNKWKAFLLNAIETSVYCLMLIAQFCFIWEIAYLFRRIQHSVTYKAEFSRLPWYCRHNAAFVILSIKMVVFFLIRSYFHTGRKQ